MRRLLCLRSIAYAVAVLLLAVACRDSASDDGAPPPRKAGAASRVVRLAGTTLVLHYPEALVSGVVEHSVAECKDHPLTLAP